MQDFTKGLLFAWFIALFTSPFFWGSEQTEAHALHIKEQTSHWIWPSNGMITDSFGTRKGEHKGIDIAANFGSPIYAVDEGIVTKSYYSGSYGNVVFIKHKNNFETVYAHLKSRNVIEGNMVKQGEVIGSMGNTGDSSGVHLHFEIHQNEWTFSKLNAINPMLALEQVVIGQYVFADKAKSLEVSGQTQVTSQNVKNMGSYQEGADKASKKIIHVVQSGETLWSIAKKYQTTVHALATINNLSGSKIITNQQIIIKK